jgi:hypothetical protein
VLLAQKMLTDLLWSQTTVGFSETYVIQSVMRILDFMVKYEHSPMISFFPEIPAKYGKFHNETLDFAP